MAHRLRLGQAGQADAAPALQAAEAGRERLRLVEIDAGAVEPADLEDQRLLLGERPVAREGRGGGGVLRRTRGAARIALAARRFIGHVNAGGGIGAVRLWGGGTALAVQHLTISHCLLVMAIMADLTILRSFVIMAGLSRAPTS